MNTERKRDLLKIILAAIRIIAASLLVVLISYFTARFSGVSSFGFAWVINFSLMAWYTYLNSIIKFSLRSSYFKSREWEKRFPVYRYLGVNYFKKFLVLIGWEKITRKENPITRDKTVLKTLAYNSRSSEFGHTIIAVILFILSIGVANTIAEAKWLLITNVILNIYPVILQRYNRQHYERLKKYLPQDQITRFDLFR